MVPAAALPPAGLAEAAATAFWAPAFLAGASALEAFFAFEADAPPLAPFAPPSGSSSALCFGRVDRLVAGGADLSASGSLPARLELGPPTPRSRREDPDAPEPLPWQDGGATGIATAAAGAALELPTDRRTAGAGADAAVVSRAVLSLRDRFASGTDAGAGAVVGVGVGWDESALRFRVRIFMNENSHTFMHLRRGGVHRRGRSQN